MISICFHPRILLAWMVHVIGMYVIPMYYVLYGKMTFTPTMAIVAISAVIASVLAYVIAPDYMGK